MQLNSEGFVVAKGERKLINRNSAALRNLKPVVFMTDAELSACVTGDEFVFDTECYRNFWYLAFKHLKTGKFVAFERSPAGDFNIEKLRWMLWRFLFVGFNSLSYDWPMIALALTGASCDELKNASDFIIKSGINYGTKKVTTFDFERKYRLKVKSYNSIDLFNVCPINGGLTATPASLKLYGGRLHCARMQDLPFDESHILTEEEAEIVRPYCCNDLDVTELVYEKLRPEIDLRVEMTARYNVELRSKSDAQIAEAVVNSELEKLTGFYPKQPKEKDYGGLKYSVPSYLKFDSPELNKVLQDIAAAEFYLDGNGSPMWPKGLGEKVKETKDIYQLKVTVNGKIYKLGMGGLHSQEKSACYQADANTIIADNDVESFYPRIILNQRLFPKHLGDAFLQVYESIVSTRLHAKEMAKKCKKAGDKAGEKAWKVIADSLKITINGLFGKLGNKYSTVYAPQLMLQVTITGQLSLLMLIEMLEKAGIECVSGNTDGVVSRYAAHMHETCRRVIAEWEALTNFKTEETRYGMIASDDVNNYLAAKLAFDDANKIYTPKIEEMKVKGGYSERGSAGNSVLSKNPETLICSDAVQAFIKDGTPIIQTIRECKDIRRFVTVKNVKGGGEKNGEYLGKVVRWYYAKNEAGFIAYVGSGNKVQKSDGAKPCMDLPESFPDDINYDWYVKEATEMLYNCGIFKQATTASLF